MNRVPIPKAVRFEVFKRDRFKCQYCGAKAPESVLHVDHIDPVAAGGSNDLTNLITACGACNLGKGSRKLDDQSAIQKSLRQMDELQERREQLEMLMQWKEGLRDLKEELIDKLAEYWHGHAPGYSLNENGRSSLRKWAIKFSADELTSAMDIASIQYLRFDDNGCCTLESWEEAFSKISGICSVKRQEQDDPDAGQLYYVRGILRKRIRYYYDNNLALQLLKAAYSWGVPIEALKTMALNVDTWTKFSGAIDELVAEYKSEVRGS